MKKKLPFFALIVFLSQYYPLAAVKKKLFN